MEPVDVTIIEKEALKLEEVRKIADPAKRDAAICEYLISSNAYSTSSLSAPPAFCRYKVQLMQHWFSFYQLLSPAKRLDVLNDLAQQYEYLERFNLTKNQVAQFLAFILDKQSIYKNIAEDSEKIFEAILGPAPIRQSGFIAAFWFLRTQHFLDKIHQDLHLTELTRIGMQPRLVIEDVLAALNFEMALAFALTFGKESEIDADYLRSQSFILPKLGFIDGWNPPAARIFTALEQFSKEKILASLTAQHIVSWIENAGFNNALVLLAALNQSHHSLAMNLIEDTIRLKIHKISSSNPWLFEFLVVFCTDILETTGSVFNEETCKNSTLFDKLARPYFAVFNFLGFWGHDDGNLLYLCQSAAALGADLGGLVLAKSLNRCPALITKEQCMHILDQFIDYKFAGDLNDIASASYAKFTINYPKGFQITTNLNRESLRLFYNFHVMVEFMNLEKLLPSSSHTSAAGPSTALMQQYQQQNQVYTVRDVDIWLYFFALIKKRVNISQALLFILNKAALKSQTDDPIILTYLIDSIKELGRPEAIFIIINGNISLGSDLYDATLAKGYIMLLSNMDTMTRTAFLTDYFKYFNATNNTPKLTLALRRLGLYDPININKRVQLLNWTLDTLKETASEAALASVPSWVNYSHPLLELAIEQLSEHQGSMGTSVASFERQLKAILTPRDQAKLEAFLASNDHTSESLKVGMKKGGFQKPR